MMDSTKFQVNFIMNEFTKVKHKYEKATMEKKSLEVTVKLLRDKLQKVEKQRFDLIALTKNRILHYDTKNESLKRENENLQTVVSEQNHTISEQINTINELRQEIETLKANRNQNSRLNNKVSVNLDCDSTKGTQFRIKKKQNNNTFTHPCLMSDDDVVGKKYKKKVKAPQFRWPHLDISISNDSTSQMNCSFDSSAKDTSFNVSKSDRKRKLYVEDDGTVDLNYENEDSV